MLLLLCTKLFATMNPLMLPSSSIDSLQPVIRLVKVLPMIDTLFRGVVPLVPATTRPKASGDHFAGQFPV